MAEITIRIRDKDIEDEAGNIDIAFEWNPPLGDDDEEVTNAQAFSVKILEWLSEAYGQ